MMRDGKCFALPMSVRRIAASASSSPPEWPTPDAGHFNDQEAPKAWLARAAEVKPRGINTGTPLGMAVRMWPTATAGDSKSSGAAGYSTASGRHAGVTLTDATARWPTPRAAFNTSPNREGGPSLNVQVGEQTRAALNPAWVCALMGFPLGWGELPAGHPALARRKPSGNRRAPLPASSTEPASSKPTATPASLRKRKKARDVY